MRTRIPRLLRALRQAEMFRQQLDAGEAESRAALAVNHGLTRARVTQVMALLNDAIACGTDAGLSERALRKVVPLSAVEQERWLRDRLGLTRRKDTALRTHRG